MGLQVQPVIAVTSGAYTAINASTFARYVEIEEDGSGPPAGILVEMPVPDGKGGWLPNGNPFELTAAQQPLRIGNPGGGAGPFVGAPAGGSSPNAIATTYCFIKSVGATSKIQVRETN